MASMLQDREHSRSQAPAFTDQTLWNNLGRDQPFTSIVVPWLALQCSAVDGVLAACVRVEADEDRAEPALAFWPEMQGDLALDTAIGTSQQQQRGVLEEFREFPGGYILAYPVLVGGRAVGGVGFRLRARTPEALHLAMRQIQWGIAWLRERLLAEKLDAQRADALSGRAILELLVSALEPESFAASARAVATDLAQRYGCDRVAVGMVRKGRVEIEAISHSANFGKDMNLVRLLGEAMDEAVDQRVVIAYPTPPDSLTAVRAHDALAAGHGAGAILTLPMHLRDRFVGAITLERGSGSVFGQEDAATLDALAAALAPVLEEKRANDQPLWTKAWHALEAEVQRLFGPAYAVRKALVLGVVLLSLIFLIWHDTYRVTANAVVEGQVQRSLVVAFNGFLREAPARAGDVVKQGDVLAALDDRDLVLERLKWTTERQRRAFEYEKALGEHNRAEMRVTASMIEQADAQIQLVDEQLSRARITAPFDGLIVSGDHSQSIGSAVQRGQVLFEISPTDGHRVILSLDEAQIDAVKAGLTGRLVLASLPGEGFPIEIVRLTPVAKVEEGRTVFRVEARPTVATATFRPGMRGIAKVEIDRRRVIWVWTRTFRDWLRMSLWRWIP